MASEQVLDIPVRRHVLTSEPPFQVVPDASITILIQELPGGGTQVAYDTVASAIAPNGDAAASQVAERLDTEVLSLLHHATGTPATATAARRTRRTP